MSQKKNESILEGFAKLGLLKSGNYSSALAAVLDLEIAALKKIDEAKKAEEAKKLAESTAIEAKAAEKSTDDENDMDEAKRVKVKKSTSAQRAKWRKYAKKGSVRAAAKKYRNKASTKKHRAKMAKLVAKIRGDKPAGRTRIVMSKESETTQTDNEISKDEMKEGFAKLADTSSVLAERFLTFAEELAESGNEAEAAECREFATFAAEIVEDSAEAVEAIAEEGVDMAEIADTFSEAFDLLTSLAETYEAVSSDTEDESGND